MKGYAPVHDDWAQRVIGFHCQADHLALQSLVPGLRARE